jgi:hypothetical protein
MDSLLLFKAVIFSVLGLCSLSGLALLSISAKKQPGLGGPIKGTIRLAFFVAGLSAALALFFAYQLQKQDAAERQLKGMDTHGIRLSHLA